MRFVDDSPSVFTFPKWTTLPPSLPSLSEVWYYVPVVETFVYPFFSPGFSLSESIVIWRRLRNWTGCPSRPRYWHLLRTKTNFEWVQKSRLRFILYFRWYRMFGRCLSGDYIKNTVEDDEKEDWEGEESLRTCGFVWGWSHRKVNNKGHGPYRKRV